MQTKQREKGLPRDVRKATFRSVVGDNSPGNLVLVEGQYEARLAVSNSEIISALRLRHEVFNVELGNETPRETGSSLEFDAFDHSCRHLIVIDRKSGRTVGTYRLNTMETAKTIAGFYSSSEFTIEDLPADVLRTGIEIGRVCIARDHRNSRVLFILWKALNAYLLAAGKRYFFGCCSIFSRETELGARAFSQLKRDGHLSGLMSVKPKHDAIPESFASRIEPIELPPLFNMYLRLGAKVCGPPMIDRDFGTIDFFVVFDVAAMTEKYRRMFAVK